MGQTKDKALSKAELEVMTVLWRQGKLSIREMSEVLPAKRQLAYATLRGVVYRLAKKGAIRRVAEDGQAFIYKAVITEEAVRRGGVDELLAFLRGEPGPYVDYVVEADGFNPSAVERAAARIERKR